MEYIPPEIMEKCGKIILLTRRLEWHIRSIRYTAADTDGDTIKRAGERLEKASDEIRKIDDYIRKKSRSKLTCFLFTAKVCSDTQNRC